MKKAWDINECFLKNLYFLNLEKFYATPSKKMAVNSLKHLKMFLVHRIFMLYELCKWLYVLRTCTCILFPGTPIVFTLDFWIVISNFRPFNTSSPEEVIVKVMWLIKVITVIHQRRYQNERCDSGHGVLQTHISIMESVYK